MIVLPGAGAGHRAHVNVLDPATVEVSCTTTGAAAVGGKPVNAANNWSASATGCSLEPPGPRG